MVELNNQNSANMTHDAFRLIEKHIDMLTLGHDFKFFLLTSTLPNEGTYEVTRGLARELCSQRHEVLVLHERDNYDTINKKRPSSFAELSGIFLKEKISSGLVHDFGLLDLFLLIHLQKKSGDLKLHAQNGRNFIAEFCRGQIVSFKTPETDMRFALSWCNYQNPAIMGPILRKNRNSKKPLIISLLDCAKIETRELLAGFKNELLEIYSRISSEPLWDFEFVDADKRRFEGLLRHTAAFLLEDIPLEERHFITRMTREAARKTGEGFMTLSFDDSDVISLYSKNEMHRLINILMRQFDRILLQTTSYKKNLIRAFESCAGGSLLIVRQNFAPKRKIKRVVRQLQASPNVLLGAILKKDYEDENQVENF